MILFATVGRRRRGGLESGARGDEERARGRRCSGRFSRRSGDGQRALKFARARASRQPGGGVW